jgi:MFS family permease
MQESLSISPIGWGWVTAIFTLAYAIFEIPSGSMGDRLGARRVLTRIVLWWSVFTSLTGLVTGFYPLLAVRFFFGVGEAGAFPNASVAVSRWFPVLERGRAFGIIMMASQFGGAVAPLLVVPIQAHYGWRASFYIFGCLGIGWSIAWYRWFRDSPEQMKGISESEVEETSGLVSRTHHNFPWRTVVRSGNLWAILGVAGCYVYTYNFFQSWFHTYLVKAHGFSEHDLLLSSLPFIVGGLANFVGGLASNRAVGKLGLVWGRRSIGLSGLAVSAICTIALILTHNSVLALALLCLIYGAICFQQPSVFAVCLDIGGEYAGAIVGAMNTSSQVGSFASSLAFGYFVEHFRSYTLPFLPMAALLIVGFWLWFKIDAQKQLLPEIGPLRDGEQAV